MHLIELSEWEINLILNALGELPYNQVAAVIQNIKEQIEKEESPCTKLH